MRCKGKTIILFILANSLIIYGSNDSILFLHKDPRLTIIGVICSLNFCIFVILFEYMKINISICLVRSSDLHTSAKPCFYSVNRVGFKEGLMDEVHHPEMPNTL